MNYRKLSIIAIIFLVILAMGLLAARLYLPVLIKDLVNQQLADIPGYEGEVQDIDIHLYRCAYTIHQLEIRKTGSGIPVPFANIETMDMAVQWNALLHGRVVAVIRVDKPILNFAVNPQGTQTQTGQGIDWAERVKKLAPIDINSVKITNGKVAYRDFSTDPKINLHIHNISGEVQNLRNVVDKDQPLPSLVVFRGDSIGNGKLQVFGRMNALATPTEMEMSLKLEKVDLPAINQYFQAFALIDVKKGDFDLYSEFKVHKGYVDGYVKPIATHVSLIDLQKDANPIDVAWEAVASLVLEIFTNHSKDQFATKIPISGNINDVNTDSWAAIIGIFHNAFIEALKKGPDGELRLLYNPPEKQ